MTTTTLPDTAEALLQQMVRIDTVNGAISGRPRAEEPLCDYLEAIAKLAGFSTQRITVENRCENLMLRFEVAPDKPWVMFESHMDTVTVDGMTIDPFGAEIRDGRLWGRGSCDTKGTGATMFWAMREYAAGSDQPNNIALTFTVDEEICMAGVRGLIKHFPKLGFRPRGVIVGEPTMLKPIVAHNGCVRWRIVTKGVAAHSANPSLGRSAISDMVRVIDELEGSYIPGLSASHPLTGKAQCSVNIIRGGVQENVIPESCEIAIDRRVVPGEDAHAVLSAVEAHLDKVRARVPVIDVRISDSMIFPPMSDKHNAKVLTSVQAALRSLGLPVDPTGVPFATDGGDLDHAGIPAVVIGPGDIAQAHTKDEWIALDQIPKGVAAYLAMMRAPW